MIWGVFLGALEQCGGHTGSLTKGSPWQNLPVLTLTWSSGSRERQALEAVPPFPRPRQECG